MADGRWEMAKRRGGRRPAPRVYDPGEGRHTGRREMADGERINLWGGGRRGTAVEVV